MIRVGTHFLIKEALISYVELLDDGTVLIHQGRHGPPFSFYGGAADAVRRYFESIGGPDILTTSSVKDSRQ